MNALEGSKTAAKLSSGDIATNATHQHSIDTLGFDYASIDVCFEPVAAAGTNSAVAIALTLQQGDTTSSYTDVTGFVGGTSFQGLASRRKLLLPLLPLALTCLSAANA